MKLSAVILTYNEEPMIKDCILSLSFADEVLIIDNESTDATREIAKKYGAKVWVHKQENFALQRMYAKQKTLGEWILYLDADERISEPLANEIISVLSSNEIVAYKIPRKNYYLGKHPWPKIELLERLFLKNSLLRWEGSVHETPIVNGKIRELENPILHFTHRDLDSMINKTLLWSDYDVENLLRANHPPMSSWRFLRVMVTKFYNSYIKQSGWKAGTVGLIESIFQAYSYFIIYAKLWERQMKDK